MLLRYTGTVSELLAYCIVAAMVELSAPVCHCSHLCRSSSLLYECAVELSTVPSSPYAHFGASLYAGTIAFATVFYLLPIVDHQIGTLMAEMLLTSAEHIKTTLRYAQMSGNAHGPIHCSRRVLRWSNRHLPTMFMKVLEFAN